MKKLCFIPWIAAALLIAAFVMLPKTYFSENENRYLKELKDISPQAFFDGELTEDISLYLSDHFPLRDEFMGLHTVFSRYILGKRELNGVYFANDDYYIEKYKKPENTEKLIKGFNAFADSLEESEAVLCLVPTQISVYRDMLPSYVYEEKTQTETLKEIQKGFTGVFANISAPINAASENEKTYYRLDHHWTTFGAYTAYKALGEALGYKPLEREAFTVETASEDFRGTVFSKLNIPWLKGEPIEIYKRNTPLNVTYEDGKIKKTSHSLYNMEYASKKDKYSLFLDNIHSLITIENPALKGGKELAVIKDSYANCLIPFLSEHFYKIYVFDTRYYKGSVSDYINNTSAEKTLILYNLNTIDTDLGAAAVY